jgi:TBC1 domain-containing protein 4
MMIYSGLGEKRQQAAILRRMEQLPTEEQESLLAKLRGGTVEGGAKEQNEFLMVLLRVHCEGKQIRHVHDTAENR